MARKKLGLLCGGRSAEHQVSLMSARSILGALDPERYEVTVLGITLTGRLLLGENVLERLEAGVPPAEGLPIGHLAGDAFSHLDVIFPVLHGPFGEDGTIQGLLELVDLPYVGSGVLGSALSMDKGAMKAAFEAAGLPVGPYRLVLRSRFRAEPQRVVEEMIGELGLPLFVKPANLGSSVGISRANGAEELEQALLLAARYDRRLVVEKALSVRELECGVLGNDDAEASVVGEIRPAGTFYDYHAKYEVDSGLLIPAPVPAGTAETIRSLALQAFQCVDAAGLARVDFFWDEGSDRVYVNEINTMPGFTRSSMYPKLFAAAGLPYPDLVDRLIALALERFAERVPSGEGLEKRA